jgi:hypothetical protein
MVRRRDLAARRNVCRVDAFAFTSDPGGEAGVTREEPTGCQFCPQGVSAGASDRGLAAGKKRTAKDSRWLAPPILRSHGYC